MLAVGWEFDGTKLHRLLRQGNVGHALVSTQGDVSHHGAEAGQAIIVAVFDGLTDSTTKDVLVSQRSDSQESKERLNIFGLVLKWSPSQAQMMSGLQ